MIGREGFRGERGGISAEYMGMLLLAAAIVFALISAPVGERIARHVERLICEIAGGENCEALVAGVDPECLVSSETRESNFSVTIAVVTVGGGATLIKEVYADGRTVFTLVDNAEVAAELIAGMRARAGKIGFSAAASASAGGRMKGARVYEFTHPEKAAEFEKKVKNEGTVRDLLHQATEGDGVLGTILGGPTGLLPDPLGIRDEIADALFGDDADDLPAPTSTYVDIEAFIDGDAVLGAGVPGLDGELNAAAELAGGAKVVTSGKEKGNVELHYQLSAEAAADLGILALGPGIGGDAAINVTMTLSNQGDDVFRPKELKVTATAGYSGSPLNATEILNQSDLSGLTGVLEEVSVGSSGGSGQQVELTGKLDLTDEENLRAALGILNPAPGATGPAAVDLAQRLDEDGDLTFQVYGTRSDESGVELAAGIGVGGGVAGDSSSDSQDLSSALHRPPGGLWGVRRCGLTPS